MNTHCSISKLKIVHSSLDNENSKIGISSVKLKLFKIKIAYFVFASVVLETLLVVQE